MRDKEKDWSACARYCCTKANDNARRGRLTMGRIWRRRALAAALHASSEGWEYIGNKAVPDLTDKDRLWLTGWTT